VAKPRIALHGAISPDQIVTGASADNKPGTCAPNTLLSASAGGHSNAGLDTVLPPWRRIDRQPEPQLHQRCGQRYQKLRTHS